MIVSVVIPVSPFEMEYRTMLRNRTAHTPGPWEVDDLGLVSNATGELIQTGSRDHGGEYYENACLIAAAPDLLAALKEVVFEYGPWHDIGCPCDDTCDCKGKPIHDRINAAIRKAEDRG